MTDNVSQTFCEGMAQELRGEEMMEDIYARKTG